jgi:hypothetical protein
MRGNDEKWDRVAVIAVVSTIVILILLLVFAYVKAME